MLGGNAGRIHGFGRGRQLEPAVHALSLVRIEVEPAHQPTDEIPLGSGPYKLKSFVAGRTISYERFADYWAKDLPVTIGQYNFDEVRYEYFRDDVVQFAGSCPTPHSTGGPGGGNFQSGALGGADLSGTKAGTP